MFGFFFSEELPLNIDDVAKTNDQTFSMFINACIKNGIYFAPSKFEAGFISSMHNNKVIDETLDVVGNIIKKGNIKQ